MDDIDSMTARLKKLLKIITATVLVLLLALAIIPLFVSLDQFRPQIEEQISTLLGRDTRLGKLQLRLLPVPKLRIRDLVIGPQARADASARQVDIYPRLLPLLDGMLEIRRIQLEEVSLTQEFIEYTMTLADKQPTGEAATSDDDTGFGFYLQMVSASKVHLQLSEGPLLGPYKLEVFFAREFELNSAWLGRMDGAMRLDIRPHNDIYKVSVQATDWQMPVAPAWQFTQLAAVGDLGGDGLQLGSINVRLYEGSITGSSSINWQQGWHVQGNSEVKGLQLEAFLEPLLDAPVIAGALTGNVHYDLRAVEVADLGKRPTVDAVLTISDGVIYNADLEQATNLLGEAKKGGQTPFSTLAGDLEMKAGAIRINNLVVKSDTLEASGNILITSDNQLAGVIEVGVSKTGSLVSVPIRISGSVDAPSLRPTNEVMAGGAIGTGLLGPGFGTAIGIKVGSFLGNLFGSDDDTNTDAQANKQPARPVMFDDSDLEEE